MTDHLVLKELVNISILSASVHCLFTSGHSIYKELCKFIKKLQFLKIFKETKNYLANLKDLAHDEYIIVEGKAKKLFARYGSYINSGIIISQSNTTYYEDFLIKINMNSSYLIQTYPGTRFHDLQRSFLALPVSKWEKFFYKIFYKQSQVLNDGDKICLFGKINKNLLDVPPKFQNYLANVKAKEITLESLETLFSKIKEKHINGLYFKFLLFTLAGIFVYFQTKYFFWPKMRNSKSAIRERSRIFCKECNREPCNVICEKCYNMTEYCDGCYVNLQNKIDNEIIRLEDVKCLFCGYTLESCQKLLNSNNINQ